MDTDLEDFDRPSVDEVLQTETEAVAIPVRVTDPVKVDQLPTILKDPRTFLIPIPNDAAQENGIRKILQRNPRRARVTIIVTNQDIMVSGAPGNLERFAGGYIPAGIPIPMHWDADTELHAKGVTANTAGTDVQWAAATDTAIVTVFEEYWAR